MRLGVMQPYLFPYLGYFQLIASVDIFLIYDDVAYIKGGYINRNSILLSSGVSRFTVPVPGASPNKLISELKFSENVTKILRTIFQSYSKSPYFDDVYPIIEKILTNDERSIATICMESYCAIFTYLGLTKKILKTSNLEYDRSASAKSKLLELCHQFGADCYINAPGGRSLYAKADFSEQGVELRFIEPLAVKYQQGSREFIPNLSIIDILMNCSPEEIVILLNRYELV